METTLKCPKCGADIPLSDALREEIERDLLPAELAESSVTAGCGLVG